MKKTNNKLRKIVSSDKVNTYDNSDVFFHEKDGVYAENLNTVMLMNNAIEFTATANVPEQYRDSIFHTIRGNRRVRFLLVGLDPSRDDMILEKEISLNTNDNIKIWIRAVLGTFKQYKRIIIKNTNGVIIPAKDININIKNMKTGEEGTIQNNENLLNLALTGKDITLTITNNTENTIKIGNLAADMIIHQPDNTKDVSIEMCVVKGLCEWKEVVDKDLARLEMTKIPRNFVLNSQEMGYDSQGNIRNEMTLRFDQETEFKYLRIFIPFKGRTWGDQTWSWGDMMANPAPFIKNKSDVFRWFNVNVHRSGETSKPNSTRFHKDKMVHERNRAYIYATEPHDDQHIFYQYSNETVSGTRYAPHTSTGSNRMVTESSGSWHNRIGPTHTLNTTTQRDTPIHGTMASNSMDIDEYISPYFTISDVRRNYFYLGNIETNGGWRFKQITPTPSTGPAPITQLPREQDKGTPIKMGDTLQPYDIVRYPITPESKNANAIEDRGWVTGGDMTQQFIITNQSDHKRRNNITTTYEYPNMNTLGSQTSIGTYPIIHILGHDYPSLEFPYKSTIGLRLRIEGWIHKDDPLFSSITGYNAEVRAVKKEMNDTFESQKKGGKGTKNNRIEIDLWTIFKKLGYQ